ncbi:MAG: amidohydrolase [Clostridiales bacterium]|jgi:imidazolonepropionase-like amidohydrolase|nr:amidohydrolase [Clostridiales bacterium]
MFITHAKIHTMAGNTIDNGWIHIKENKIAAIGSHLDKPVTDEEVLDVHGAGVYPGFIDAHTHLGMWEDGLCFEGDDGNEETDPITPQLRAIDAINPMDRCFSEALAAGITTVVTGPGSANPIGGQLAAMKTAGSRVDDMIVKAPVAIKMALGENPKSVYHGKSQAPSTRMATAALIREELYKAKRYMDDLERSKNEEDFEAPEFDIKSEALLPVLRGETEVHFHAHRSDDIYTAIRIANEFHLNYVIVHGTEGHLIADTLAKEGVRVLAGPYLCDRSKPELKNQTPANPGILSKAGVFTAIITDHPVIPLQYLPTCAALAVREGMDYEEALKAITINPAQICGIDQRVGSIEVGKDADLVIFDSDPLQMTSKPIHVIADGKIML